MIKTRWLPLELHQAHSGTEERKVSWLELFYDLVYVATIIQLGNLLSHDVSLVGFVHFVALFIPIWWSWTGITFYVNRIMVDDLWHRLLIFAQIAAIVAMAISIEVAFGETASQFALAYVVVQAILIALYVRAGRHIEQARKLSVRYVRGYSLATSFWLVSVFVPEPYAAWRYVLWAAGMIAHFAVAWSPGTRRLTAALPPDIPHMSERYGLLTIIVLGESFVKGIDTAAGQVLNLPMVIYGLLGLAIAFSLWWLYFDQVAGAEIKREGLAPYIWVYTHLPLTIGLTAFGVSMKKMLSLASGEPLADNYRWLIGGALTLYMVSATILSLVTVHSEDTPAGRAKNKLYFGAAAVVLLLTLVGAWLPSMLFIAIVAIIFVAPIATNLRTGVEEEKLLLDSE